MCTLLSLDLLQRALGTPYTNIYIRFGSSLARSRVPSARASFPNTIQLLNQASTNITDKREHRLCPWRNFLQAASPEGGKVPFETMTETQSTTCSSNLILPRPKTSILSLTLVVENKHFRLSQSRRYDAQCLLSLSDYVQTVVWDVLLSASLTGFKNFQDAFDALRRRISQDTLAKRDIQG